MIANPEVASWSPNWSPDGEKIMFSEAGRDRPLILDLLTRSTQSLAGDGRLGAPRWSPDGLHVAGRSGDRLVVHNLETGQSRILAEGKFYERWYWSADSRSLFVVDNVFLGSRRSVLRINIEDGNAVKLWQIGRDSSPWGSNGRWIGVTPTGKILMLRNNSIHNIYALDWDPE